MLSGSLNEMFEKMNVNEDCYAVGPFSRLLANDLANMSDAKGRRKVRLLISFFLLIIMSCQSLPFLISYS